MSFKLKFNNTEKEFDQPVKLIDLIKDIDPKKEIICASVNNRVRELNYDVYYDATIDFLTVKDTRAVKIYEASLRYVVAMAFKNLYPDLKVKFSYSISRCIGIHLLSKQYKADTAMLLKVTHEIDRIVEEDLPLVRKVISNNDAAELYKERGYEDKLAILQFRPEKTVHLYTCGTYEDYMYSHMVPSTGYLTQYKLRLYAPDFLLQYPRAEVGGIIPEFEDSPTFIRTLNETFLWGQTVGCDTVAGINEYIKNNGLIELLNLSEARHNRMLCELGQMIQDNIQDIRLICVAGPSSSGKTTFANRLRIELLSRGIKPTRISLDDYYLEKSQIPLDENGEVDLETIEALDIPQFNKDMLALISGETVTLPKFDFKLGKRVKGRTLQIAENEPIIIEGIHALNDKMTTDIPRRNKFKVYICPQAQINLDDHNPINMTDIRLIRRMVRDKRDRNSPIEETLGMWPSVRRGEFKWIYPTQEGADYVYNSMLPYELLVMKKYIQKELQQVDKDSPNFPVCERLLRLLKYFVDMDDSWVPSNSLMREFIGGSCYADV